MADERTTKLCHVHLGARGELVASAWLLGLGYEVFRNVSGAGPADLAIWHPHTDERHLIDVKTHGSGRICADGMKSAPAVPKGHDSVHILVVDDGVVAGFFKRKTNSLPARYWPLDVPQPELPTGYNEDEDRTPPQVTTSVEWRGKLTSIADIARQEGITPSSLRGRLRRGIPLEVAVSIPVKSGVNSKIKDWRNQT